MPGFNSHAVRGDWHLGNSTLQILHADTFEFVYNGDYKINFTNNRLILKSDKTTFNCQAENIQ